MCYHLIATDPEVVKGYTVDEGTIRLVGGSYPHEGRVEYFFHGHWGTVCSSGWDLQDATVVCRQFGNLTAGAALTKTEFGPGNGAVFFARLACRGSEANITECSSWGFGVHYCSRYYVAGVICSGII